MGANKGTVRHRYILFTIFYENQPVFHEIASFLRDFDYTLFDLYETHHAMNGQITWGDAIFVSPAVRSTVLDTYADEP